MRGNNQKNSNIMIKIYIFMSLIIFLLCFIVILCIVMILMKLKIMVKDMGRVNFISIKDKISLLVIDSF